MEKAPRRLNVTLDPELAERLSQLASRVHVQEGTLARSLLSQALADSDVDARNIVELLDRIPGARERATRGLREGRRGETLSLNEL